MKDDIEQKYSEVLASLGLSQEKIDYIRRTNSDKKASKLYVIGSIACVVLVASCVVGYVFVANSIFFDYLMKERTRGVDYIFYDSVWTTQMFVVIPICILLPCWVLYKLLDYFPKASALIKLKAFDDIAYQSVNHDNVAVKFSRWYVRKLIDDKFQNMPIEQGLDYLNRKSRSWIVICMIPLIIISIPLMAMDSLNYKLVTKEGVIERGYASFYTSTKNWNDATKVETGCYYFTSNENPTLKYTVVFEDGSEVDLFEAKSKDDKITQIETLDGILRQLNKPFSIRIFSDGINRGQPYVNEECFAKLHQQYPNQYTKIIKLLRLDKYFANQ